jgi:coatomer subunit beta'
VWSLGSPDPNFTLDGHDKGVNCIAYYAGGDKPYLISGGDDFLVKVWDYQNKKCIQTMEGHTNNVTVVGFHPSLPVIVTGSEDSTVRVWHADTYRLEKTLNYGFERVWSLGFLKVRVMCLAALVVLIAPFLRAPTWWRWDTTTGRW